MYRLNLQLSPALVLFSSPDNESVVVGLLLVAGEVGSTERLNL